MIRSVFLSLLCLTLTTPVLAAEFTDAQKEAIKELVKEAILENPQTMLDSIQQFQDRQQEEERAKQEEEIKEFMANLGDSMKAYSVGNPDGDVKIVEFFDYNCGYCKKAFEEVQKLLEEDDGLYVTFFELPILGPTSLEAAKWAVAAADQDKYFDFHAALMEFTGPKNADNLEKIAKDVGLDIKKAEEYKESDEVSALLSQNREVSAALGFSGTPAFIINDTAVRGYLDFDRMKEAIALAREKAE